MRHQRSAIAWLLALTVASVWSFGLARHSFSAHAFSGAGSYTYHDEGAAVLVPLLIHRGKKPYLDFEPRFTPLGYYWMALGYSLFGIDVLSVRLMLAAVNVATALVVFGMARRAGTGVWAWAAWFGALLWGVGEYNVATPRWIAMPFGLLACFALTRAAPRPGRGAVALAGFLLGITFLLSQNTGVAAIASVVWTLALLNAANGNSDAANDGAPLAGVLPAGAAAVGVLVLGVLVWPGEVTPVWLIMVGPPALAALCIGALAWRRRSVSWRAGRTFIAQLFALVGAMCVPIVALGAWWVSQSGWQVIARSLVAGTGSLRAIYMLPPNAPPVTMLGVLAAWATVAFLVSRRNVRLGWVIALLPAAAVGLWAVWWPYASGDSLGEAVWYVSARVILDTWPHLLWLTGATAVAVTLGALLRDSEHPLDAPAATGVGAGFSALGWWIHLFPWGDYVHALWAAPPAMVAFAYLAHRLSSRIAAADSFRFAGRPVRWSTAAAVSLAPLAMVAAMGVKWFGYWYDMDATLLRGKPVPREWGLIDEAHGNIWVERSLADAWHGLVRHVRERTAPDGAVLGVPLFTMINVVTDRPFPVYDCFWWPDFTGEHRRRQEQDIVRALESGTVPLVVGPASDDTYFSLQVMSETWPDAWAVLQQRYRRTAAYGQFWVYEPREAPAP